MDVGQYDSFLVKHLPVVRYDSQEAYFADSAAEFTDNAGHVLQRADGTVIAAATPETGQAQLRLSFLGKAYGDGTAAQATDLIDAPSRDYAAQARALHAQPVYANRVYGHAATGSDGRVWLAYWFFYFYNDYDLIGDLLAAGRHEGDWEMIQLRLGEADQAPDVAVYAQHTHAEAREWKKIERVGERPVVYPGRGSHASYFSPGVHWTGVWFDYADGRRSAPDLSLEILRDDDRWALWPGRWGSTTPHPDDPLDTPSPPGPGGHSQWSDPVKLLEMAQDHQQIEPSQAPLPAPTIVLHREGQDLRVDYRTDVPNLAALVVTVNSPQEPLPPASHRAPTTAAQGTVTIVADLHDAWDYDVYVSIATADGKASTSTRGDLPAV
jgi:Vacuolar protein sorting-associated protein 62